MATKNIRSKYLSFERLLDSSGLDYQREFLVQDIFNSSYKSKFKVDYMFFRCDVPVLAVEVEGGIFTNGRHTRGVGFWNDILKYNSLTFGGVALLRFPAMSVQDEPTRIVSLISSYLSYSLTISEINRYVMDFKKVASKRKVSKVSKITKVSKVSKRSKRGGSWLFK